MSHSINRPYNTLHVEDFASAIYSLALWMQNTGHEKALAVAGSPLPPCRPVASYVRWLSGKKTETSEYDKQDLDFLAMRTETVDAPVFNIVDNSQTTTGQLTQAIAKAVGVQYSFTNTVVNQFAKLNMEAVVEDANDHHLENWPLMLEKSVPQITTPVFTPEIVRPLRVIAPFSTSQPRELMAKHATALNGSKMHRVVGWTPKHPKLSDEGIKAVHRSWQQEEGVWPKVAPLKG